MDNILSRDILHNLNSISKDDKEVYKTEYIKALVKDFISCDRTFMDNFIYFKKSIKIPPEKEPELEEEPEEKPKEDSKEKPEEGLKEKPEEEKPKEGLKESPEEGKPKEESPKESPEEGRLRKGLEEEPKVKKFLYDKIEVYGASMIDTSLSKNIVILDAAGLTFMKREVSKENAGGISAVIYNKYPNLVIPCDEGYAHFIKINNQDDIYKKKGVGALGDLGALGAFLCKYDEINILHAVGPDFTEYSTFTKEDVKEYLIKIYKDIFKVLIEKITISSDITEFRMVPISSGIFAGNYTDLIKDITLDIINDIINTNVSSSLPPLFKFKLYLYDPNNTNLYLEWKKIYEKNSNFRSGDWYRRIK